MRYLSGLMLGAAAAAHTGALAQVLGLGLLVFIGVIAFAFAIEGMIKEALRPVPATCPHAMPAIPDEMLRRYFDQPPRHKD